MEKIFSLPQLGGRGLICSTIIAAVNSSLENVANQVLWYLVARVQELSDGEQHNFSPLLISAPLLPPLVLFNIYLPPELCQVLHDFVDCCIHPIKALQPKHCMQSGSPFAIQEVLKGYWR